MKGQEKLEKAVQFLAVWLPDHLRGQEAVDFTNGYYEYMTEAVGKVADRAALVEDMSDLDRILKEGKWAFIRSIESGAALGGKLENVDHFAKLNFKMMTLTWNGINELGSGFQSEMGLTDFGKAAVRRMEEVGMIVDCSHLNDAGFEDLLNCSTKPFVASHSNLRSCAVTAAICGMTSLRRSWQEEGLWDQYLFQISLQSRMTWELGRRSSSFVSLTVC